jgi:hypothetical protein
MATTTGIAVPAQADQVKVTQDLNALALAIERRGLYQAANTSQLTAFANSTTDRPLIATQNKQLLVCWDAGTTWTKFPRATDLTTVPGEIISGTIRVDCLPPVPAHKITGPLALATTVGGTGATDVAGAQRNLDIPVMITGGYIFTSLPTDVNQSIDATFSMTFRNNPTIVITPHNWGVDVWSSNARQNGLTINVRSRRQPFDFAISWAAIGLRQTA